MTDQPEVDPATALEALLAEAGRWPAGNGPVPAAAPADLIRRLAAEVERLRAQGPEPHDCEFGCASDLEHLQRAYDELKSDYADFRRAAQGGSR